MDEKGLDDIIIKASAPIVREIGKEYDKSLCRLDSDFVLTIIESFDDLWVDFFKFFIL